MKFRRMRPAAVFLISVLVGLMPLTAFAETELESNETTAETLSTAETSPANESSAEEESSLPEESSTDESRDLTEESSGEQKKSEESSGSGTEEESAKLYGESDATDEATEGNPSVTYRTHVQTYGWQDWSVNGQDSGTVGLAKRLEAIELKVTDTSLQGGIEYMTHIQTYGWEKEWVTDGEMSGTSGEAKRLEAIRIRLTGELADNYDIYYRVHAQTLGWMDWAKNGEESGTSGLAKRLEAIQIMLVKKGEDAPGATVRPSASIPGVSYQCHSQTYGWMDRVADGVTGGVTGQDKRMECLTMNLTGETNLAGGIEYRSHVQSYGWQNWVSDGAQSGTSGLGKRLEAVQIRLTGEVDKVCDVYYRVHVESYGWLGWAKNGEIAGTSGLALKVEAIQVMIVAKSGAVPVATGGASREYSGPGYYQIGAHTYYYSANGVRREGTGWYTAGGQRHYMVNGADVTGWQYIGGYKYYFNPDGSLCQDVDHIIGVQSNYVIKINKQANCVTIYAQDGANGYIIPVKAMLCSTGDDTPLGTFYTPAKYRWKAMFNGTYAQYATRLTAGQGFLFHSVTYETTNNRTMLTEGYNGLGVIRSAGCIRLLCKNAYWIYSRCALGTKVIVYNSSTPGPFDRPVLTPIPATQRWDPTDPAL